MRHDKPPDVTAATREGGGRKGTSGNNAHHKNTRGRGNYQGYRPFEVWTTKDGSSPRFYMAYHDLKIAEGVRDRLKEIGLACELRFAGTRAATR